MKPFKPDGDFVKTVDWRHFWHCMNKPHFNPIKVKSLQGPLRQSPQQPVISVVDITDKIMLSKKVLCVVPADLKLAGF